MPSISHLHPYQGIFRTNFLRNLAPDNVTPVKDLAIIWTPLLNEHLLGEHLTKECTKTIEQNQICYGSGGAHTNNYEDALHIFQATNNIIPKLKSNPTTTTKKIPVTLPSQNSPLVSIQTTSTMSALY